MKRIALFLLVALLCAGSFVVGRKSVSADAATEQVLQWVGRNCLLQTEVVDNGNGVRITGLECIGHDSDNERIRRDKAITQ